MEVTETPRIWQLDELRMRRNARLAEAQRAYDLAHDQIWADYNRAADALSDHLTGVGA